MTRRQILVTLIAVAVAASLIWSMAATGCQAAGSPLGRGTCVEGPGR